MSTRNEAANILATPAMHFMKARVLLLDAMVSLVRGETPPQAGDGRFDHHREFQVAVWAAATGRFIKKESQDEGAKESLIFQRSLTNSKLVSLGIKAVNSKKGRARNGKGNESATLRRFYGRELPPAATAKHYTAPSPKPVDEDEITADNVVEVGKCAVEVDYIGYPWKEYACLRQLPPMGDHIKNRNKRLDPETIDARKIEEAFIGIERELADFALNTHHVDMQLVKDLHEGKINMQALIAFAINQALLSSDASVIDRRSLDLSGRYKAKLAQGNWREGQYTKAKRAANVSDQSRRRRADNTGNNVYKREYTKKRNRGGEIERKSINRDPDAPRWMTKRRGSKKVSVTTYSEMINSILPHHPDGEEDDDDKRAERIRLKTSSSSTSLASSASTTEREQSRVGDQYQADLPLLIAAGSAGGVAGANAPDPASAGDTAATISTLVSTSENYRDPTAADQADQSVFRFNIVYTEPGDSDLDYSLEDTHKPWSKVKRAAKFRKAAMSAKRAAARATGISLDVASASDSNSDDYKTNVSEEAGKPAVEEMSNINHLLLQGQLGAVPMDTDDKPKD